MAYKYIEIGDKKSATKRINELKRKNVESILGLLAQVLLADIYLLQKKYEKFEECLQTADSWATHFGFADFRHRKNKMLGISSEDKNDYEIAIKYYKESLHERPD